MNFKKLATALVLAGSLGAASASMALVSVKTDNTADLAAADTQRVNVQWNVLSTLVGEISGDVNLKVSKPFSVGITGSYWAWGLDEDSFDDMSAWSLGVQASYAFNGDIMASGWQVSPTVKYLHTKNTLGDQAASLKDHDYNNETTDSSLYVALPFVYQWMWPGGFNMQLGIGPGYSTSKKSIGKLIGYKGPTLDFRYSIGFAF